MSRTQTYIKAFKALTDATSSLIKALGATQEGVELADLNNVGFRLEDARGLVAQLKKDIQK